MISIRNPNKKEKKIALISNLNLSFLEVERNYVYGTPTVVSYEIHLEYLKKIMTI